MRLVHVEISRTNVIKRRFLQVIFFNSQVPAFESLDGKYLTDSNAIAYYVANEQLRGTTDYSRAQILKWMSFADTEILPAVCAWVFPVLGILQYNKQVRYFYEFLNLTSKLNGGYITRSI